MEIKTVCEWSVLQDDLSLRLLLLEHFVELQVQVAVQGLYEQLSGCLEDVEGP